MTLSPLRKILFLGKLVSAFTTTLRMTNSTVDAEEPYASEGATVMAQRRHDDQCMAHTLPKELILHNTEPTKFQFFSSFEELESGLNKRAGSLCDIGMSPQPDACYLLFTPDSAKDAGNLRAVTTLNNISWVAWSDEKKKHFAAFKFRPFGKSVKNIEHKGKTFDGGCLGRCGPGCDGVKTYLPGLLGRLLPDYWGAGCFVHDLCAYHLWEKKVKANQFGVLHEDQDKFCGTLLCAAQPQWRGRGNAVNSFDCFNAAFTLNSQTGVSLDKF